MRALFLALVLLTATASHASLLIEPYAGYGIGTLSTKAIGSDTTKNGASSGVVYGGRLGFLARHFAILAAEYQGMNGKMKMDDVATSDKWQQSSIFAEMGFQSAMGFRLLGGYAFDARMTQAGTPNTVFKGSAYKFTLGWVTPADFAINAEYTIYNLKTSTQNGVSTTLNDSFSKYDYSVAMVTLSLPLTFFSGGGRGR
jgi:hypothetical protein